MNIRSAILSQNLCIRTPSRIRQVVHCIVLKRLDLPMDAVGGLWHAALSNRPEDEEREGNTSSIRGLTISDVSWDRFLSTHPSSS